MWERECWFDVTFDLSVSSRPRPVARVYDLVSGCGYPRVCLWESVYWFDATMSCCSYSNITLLYFECVYQWFSVVASLREIVYWFDAALICRFHPDTVLLCMCERDRECVRASVYMYAVLLYECVVAYSAKAFILKASSMWSRLLKNTDVVTSRILTVKMLIYVYMCGTRVLQNDACTHLLCRSYEWYCTQ